MRTLVLNQNYEVLGVVDWFEAFCMTLQEKVDVVETYDKPVRSAYQIWKMPAVVMTKQFIKTHKRNTLFNASLRNVLIRDNWTCAYCGKALTPGNASKDHVIPLSKNGKNTIDNIVAACRACNRNKGNHSCQEVNMFPKNPPRNLTEEEKIKSMVKSVKSSERSVWLAYLKRNGITLW